MILSALLTSVGINLGLCFLFFALYSILRKQPSNISVYAPRLVADESAPQSDQFNLSNLIPSAGWVRRAWKLSEEQLLLRSGLDAVVFMRIFIFGLKIFTFAAIIGFFILLPINYTGNQVNIDFSDLPRKSLESFSISNVESGSKRLWFHFAAVYVFTSFVCCFLYLEYKYISEKKVAHFYAMDPQPHHFNILVCAVPVTSGSSYSETVEKFFMDHYPSSYLSHMIVRRRNNFQGPIEIPAAFVSFRSRFGAAVALNIQQGVNPTEWVTEEAPEAQDVYWPFFSASFIKRWFCKLLVLVASAALTIIFLIPVVVVQGLANLQQLESWLPFLKTVMDVSVISQVVTGYLPTLVLHLFLSLVPPIMMVFSSMQGHLSLSRIQQSACTKMLWFTIWNIFFANVLSGTVLHQLNVFLEPKKVPRVLAESVPAQASFFISYVVTSGWTSLSSELFQLIPLLCSYMRIACRKKKPGDGVDVPPMIPYHSEIPRVLFFGLLGITYFFLAPLILPFILIYYCLGYIIYRNQLLNVYAPRFDSCGKMWPIVHNATVFSLVLMHVIAVGLFGTKKLPLASTLTIPLPFLTLLFNEYCRKRFLPLFRALPAECLIRKDRDDQKSGRMDRFLLTLPTLYTDPALHPADRSTASPLPGNHDAEPALYSPLLRTVSS